MTDRKPTTEEVRAGYELGDDRILPGEDKAWMAQARRAAEFDRWLRKHDAEVLREAAERYWADVSITRYREQRDWLNAEADRIEAGE